MKQDFEHFLTLHENACILMNNIQQLRVQLEKVYEAMGGTNLQEDTRDSLQWLQARLNKVIDELAQEFTDSLEPQIKQSVITLGDLLHQVSGKYWIEQL